MVKNRIPTAFIMMLATAMTAHAQDTPSDTLMTNRNHTLEEVVVTGTRNETDIRHLSQLYR